MVGKCSTPSQADVEHRARHNAAPCEHPAPRRSFAPGRGRAAADPTRRALRWGLAVGILQAAVALAFWWLDLLTVHALMLGVIAAIYVGFAVSDGRTKVIVVESSIVVAFVIAAAAAVPVSPWLLVVIYLSHGAKDLWQHRTRFVRGTRWWPPFCFAIDVTVAVIIAGQILLGVPFR